MASVHTQLAQAEHRVRELEAALERQRELTAQADRRATMAEEGRRLAWRTILKATDRRIRGSAS